MCTNCGCANHSGEVQIDAGNGDRSHEHHHDHHHDHHSHEHHHNHHPHEHHHQHHHEHNPQHRKLEVREAILSQNDRLAERNRGFFLAKGLLVLNVLSSPGSGKTAFIQRTLTDLGQNLPGAVVVGDLATDNDAQRLRQSGAQVVQITTGDICHLEAAMVAQAIARLNLEDVRLLVIENVGNLVCPAAYDLGENLRVALLSVTEGEDKPLKYPTLFKTADVAVITKTDIAEAVGFDRDLALANLQAIAPQATVLEVSARTGSGMDTWYRYLQAQATIPTGQTLAEATI